EHVNEALASVEAEADAFLGGLAGLPVVDTRKDFFVEARYRAQGWELDVPVPRRLEGDEGVRDPGEAFPATHQRIFAVPEPGQQPECLPGKARATAVLAKPELRAGSADAAAAASPAAETAEAYFAETGLGAVPRYDGRALVAGTRI